MIALKTEGVHTFYGKSHSLHGVRLPLRARVRPIRLRSVVVLSRAVAAEQRHDLALAHFEIRRRRDRISAVPDRRGRRRLCAGGPAHLRQPWTRTCWSLSSGPARGRFGAFTRRFRVTPSAGRTRAPNSPAAGRRCCHRPRPDLEPESAHARRAPAGLSALKIVVAARREGVSILLVEQDVRAAVEIADRAYVLDDSRIVYEGEAWAFGADEQRVCELAGASAEKWDMEA
jgi:branched-chain amino acid transport system ATP-binding protein